MRYPIYRFKVASPCSEDWDEMRGDDRIRFCSHCNLEVHNFSAMTRREIQDLVARSNGQLCARYIHTPKGKIKTLDYTPPLVNIARRASRIAAAPLAVAMTLASASAAERRAPSEPAAAQAPADAEKKPTGPTGEVRGIVRDKEGRPVAKANVTLRSDDESFSAETNELGEYRFENVPGGSYSIEAISEESLVTDTVDIVVIPGGVAAQTLELGDLLRVTMGAAIMISRASGLIDYSKEMQASGRESKSLHFVEIFDEAASIEEALQLGADVDERGAFGATPLMALVYDEENVKALLAVGANPDAADEFGVTPLIEAAANWSRDSIKLLVAAGANVNAADARGNTALILAAANDDGEALKLLVAAGADVNARTRAGRSALSLAIEYECEEAIALLRAAGASE